MSKLGEVVGWGRLRYLQTKEVVVYAATSKGNFKLFRVQFGKDGSIYVPFPYLETHGGILAEADPSTEPDPKSLTLSRNGVATRYDVKFSHHTSGIVQFSKSGSGDLLPRRKSFALDGPMGKVFEFFVMHPEGFQKLDPYRRETRVALNFENYYPMSIHVAAEWRRKRDIAASMAPGTAFIGPTTTTIRRDSGYRRIWTLIAQPRQSPLQDHVLMVSAESRDLPQGADKPMMIFLGGFDPHEGGTPESPKHLAFMFPAGRGDLPEQENQGGGGA